MSRNPFVLRLVALVVLISMILTACAPAATPAAEVPQAEAPAAEATATEEPTPVPPTATAEPAVELTYTYPGSIPNDLASVEAALSEVTLAKFNATIKLNPVDWGAYTDKVNLMVAAGETCDVLFVAPWMNPSYAQLVANGALYPLNDLLETTPELVSSMPAGAFDATKIDGKIYGVPNQQIWSKPFGPAVRSDLAEKYAFDINSITKLEDLETFLAAVKAGETEVSYPAAGGAFTNEFFGWDPIVSQDAGIVVKYDDAGLTVFNAYDTPEFKAHVELMRKWYEAGYFPRDLVPGEDFNNVWKAGKVGSALLEVVKPTLSNEWKNSRGYDVNAKALGPNFTSTGSVTATMNAVCQTSTAPEKALAFLSLLNTDASFYNTLAKGVEGKHWVWTDEAAKIIEPGPEKDSYNPGSDWMFGNTFNAYYSDATSGKLQEETAAINASAVPSVALGFTFNPEPVKNELAQVTAVVTEKGRPLYNGEIDPTTALPEFLQALKDAGIDTIIAEAQAQLNAFAGK
ncbi:MAG: ABC transporter substrate-binding protein [Anaerolineae bacterium]|nr:ABC transporter substrate-binding protein [Anaerolineae bacterium]